MSGYRRTQSVKKIKPDDVAASTRANIAGMATSAVPMLIPVTGIGASAGGLEPIEQFFDAMPVDSGSAFVIIQHLSPKHKSLMDELLGRHSNMKIIKIEEGTEIKPNSIYLNTPRTVMTVDGNHLRVKDFDPQEHLHLPIDLFFNSLAASRGADSIGIVLSGTGTDGTQGSIVVREAGGNVLVQDPATAKFEGMPQSVLTNGMSTLSASPPVLANCVVKLLGKEPIDDFVTNKHLPASDPFTDVLSMLKQSQGTDFLQYKDTTIRRRMERRAQMRGIEDISDYRDFLAVDDNGGLEELYADLLIEVTEFFRDQEAFQVLEERVISSLIDDLPEGDTLRVWVPGCASGEEAYSIAILIQEQARKIGAVVPLKIMASDIHVRSMNQASGGVYEKSALKNVPQEIVDRYFDITDGQAQIKSKLRNMVFFSTHDLTRDPPFTRIDLIACRNLLIYLKEEAQDKVISLLHFSLRKDGYLFLGPSEHIGAISHEFESVSDKWRIYRKLRDVKLITADSIFDRNNVVGKILPKSPLAPFVQKRESTPSDDSIHLKMVYREALENIVEGYAPPGFLLNEDGAVVHIFGSAEDLVSVPTGTFSRQLVDLIKPELKAVVKTALERGSHKEFSEFQRTAYVRSDTEGQVSYEIRLSKIDLRGRALKYLLLTVKQLSDEVPQGANTRQEELAEYDSSDALRQRIGELEHRLHSSEESLQSSIEEIETSNEELQSTNEELMSTNEELQSTNEELHSVNEELYTVSSEHQRKIEDLTERDADIDLLLQESKIGTIHLDDEMRLRRYSKNARNVFNLLPQDIGRPIQHITMRGEGDDDLVEIVERVSAGHETLETKVVSGVTVSLVRVIPYRPQETEPSGVVITIIDISDIENVSSQNSQYNTLAEEMNTSLLRWDAKTSMVKNCNSVFAKARGCSVEDIIGQDVWNYFPVDDREKFKQLVSELEPDGVQSVVLDLVDANGRPESKKFSIRAISHDGDNVHEYQSSEQDITSEVNSSKALEKLFS